MNVHATILTILLAVCAGVAVWLGIGLVTEEPANWGNPTYVNYGLPICALLCAALGFLEPDEPWAWGLVMMVSQGMLLALTVPPEQHALLLTGFGTMVLLAVPTVAAAYAGKGMRAWVAAD